MRRGESVLFVMPEFADGGVERAWFNTAEGMLELGLRPVVVALGRRPQAIPLRVPDGVELVALASYGLLPSIVRLRRLLAEVDPVLVVGGLTPANLTVIGAATGRRSRVRILVSVHIDIAGQRDIPAIRRVLSRWIHRRVLPEADAIVAPSEGVATGLARIGVPEASIKVIPNAIVTPSIRLQLREGCDHPWFFQDSEEPVILGMGRLTPQKDFVTLLKAFHIVCQTRPARLVILGEGPERRRLEEVIEGLGLAERVDLPGFVSNPFPYLREADVFCLSSRWEGFGNVLVEALAAGTSVVATDCPSGPREILDGGRLGVLVPVECPSAMAEAVDSVLRSEPAPQDEMRSRSADFAAAHVARQYLRAAGLQPPVT